ncbi:MAG: hypothetical protein ABFD15_01270 [Methanofastidiosum sp.]
MLYFCFSVRSQGLQFEQILKYNPPGGTTGCTNSRLLYEGSGVIPPIQESDSSIQQFTRAVSVVVNDNPAVHTWGDIPFKPQCNY